MWGVVECVGGAITCVGGTVACVVACVGGAVGEQRQWLLECLWRVAIALDLHKLEKVIEKTVAYRS